VGVNDGHTGGGVVSSTKWNPEIEVFSMECDDLVELCKECTDKYCSDCQDEHCKNDCTANGLEAVCLGCDISDELNCAECAEAELSDRLGCENCDEKDKVCTDCEHVKDCDYRR